MAHRVLTIAESYRARSEDRIAVIETSAGTVIAVADGMGGRAGGFEAADRAIATLRDRAMRAKDIGDASYWHQALSDADHIIRDDANAGETTAVVVAVAGDRIVGASVGDSAAWLITADRYFDLTAGQVRKPGLGTGMAQPVPFHSRVVSGALLAATDGLTKYAAPEEICAIVRTSPSDVAPRALLDLVRLPRGSYPDDVAVALCWFQ